MRLVVDVSKLTTRLLEQPIFIVYSAGNGARCLDMLRTETCDSVLLDSGMSTTDGFETITRIRETEKENAIASTQQIMISLTGTCESRYKQDAYALGKTSETNRLIYYDHLNYRILISQCLNRHGCHNRETADASSFERESTKIVCWEPLKAVLSVQSHL